MEQWKILLRKLQARRKEKQAAVLQAELARQAAKAEQDALRRASATCEFGSRFR